MPTTADHSHHPLVPPSNAIPIALTRTHGRWHPSDRNRIPLGPPGRYKYLVEGSNPPSPPPLTRGTVRPLRKCHKNSETGFCHRGSRRFIILNTSLYICLNKSLYISDNTTGEDRVTTGEDYWIPLARIVIPLRGIENPRERDYEST